MNFPINENEDCFLHFPLKYGHLWSARSSRGTDLTKADVDTVYFNVSETEHADPWLELTSANTSQIAWLDDDGEETTDSTAHVIRVKLGSNTDTHVGDSQFFELRIKFSSGAYTTMASGKLDIIESQVDRP